MLPVNPTQDDIRDEISRIQRVLARTADTYLQEVIRKELAALRERMKSAPSFWHPR
jgi:predicted translin family RNA/ssDNA-binding protein